MARVKFDVVKAEKPAITNEASKEKKPVKSKYFILARTLKQLNINDYVIFKKGISPLSLKSTIANTKTHLKKQLSSTSTKQYEVHYILEGGNYNVIVKRVK